MHCFVLTLEIPLELPKCCKCPITLKPYFNPIIQRVSVSIRVLMHKTEPILGMLSRNQILKNSQSGWDWASARLPLVPLNPTAHQHSCNPETETVATTTTADPAALTTSTAASSHPQSCWYPNCPAAAVIAS